MLLCKPLPGLVIKQHSESVSVFAKGLSTCDLQKLAQFAYSICAGSQRRTMSVTM